jgi:glycerophosphoryl diester phosphodiesterase
LDSLWDGWLEAALEIDCLAIVCNYKLWNQELVDTVHAQKMRCLSYTVNQEDVAESLVALGTNGIITDSIDNLGE